YQAGITGNGNTNGKVAANDGSAAGSSSLQLFNRQAWGGLSGSFGEVRFGLQDSVPFQTFVNLDYNGASNGVSAAVYTGAGLWASSRQGHSLQYISPSLGGLTVQVGYVMGGSQDYADGASFKDGDDPDDRTTWTGADDKDTKNVASAGLTYVIGSATLAAAYQGSGKDDDAGTSDFDESAAYFGFGAQYDFGTFKVKADYQKQDTKSGVNLGAVTTVAGWSVGAQYSVGTDESKTVYSDNVKTSGYELFVNKEVLKNVYGYAEIGSGKTDQDGAETNTGFAVGMILVF
ncbi:porin, partial [Leptospira sp. 96542]|nr:porin [Leptospira sp. 96542]